MVSKDKINKLWPVYLGEFYNPEHNTIKSNLLDCFDQYMKKNPNSRKGPENHKVFENNKPIPSN